ncbi:MAG: TauD/TfdA family dioxygenase [Alphaproteobacteria bacterium]|nr:TauD/TfdA family dioxygenase [Alphaproteobacteria bacterium]
MTLAITHLSLRKLHPALGAEVSGVDLSRPLDPPTVAAIRDAWHRHHLLLFRGQPISDAQHVAFARNFAELELFPIGENRAGRAPEIFRVANTDEDGRLRSPDSETWRYLSLIEFWHTDSSYRPVPSLGAILRALEVPEEGGNTLFANLLAAYAALSEATKRRIDRLKVRHSFLFARSLRGLPPMKPEEAASVPDVEHALVRVHPDREGQKSLYLSHCYMQDVLGLPRSEAQRLIDDLHRHATRPEFVYRHVWQKHDILMWDNRVTMHAVTPFNVGRDRRVMHRTALKGLEAVRSVA